MADLDAILEVLTQLKNKVEKQSEQLDKQSEQLDKQREQHDKEVSELKEKVVSLQEQQNKVSDKHLDLPTDKILKISKSLDSRLEEVNWKDLTRAHHFIKRLHKEFSELSVKEFARCVRGAYSKVYKGERDLPNIDDKSNLDTYLSKLLGVSEDYQGAGLLMWAYKAELPIIKTGNTLATDYDEAYKRLLEKQRFCFEQIIKASHEAPGLREKLGKGTDEEILQTYIDHQMCTALGHYRILFGHHEFLSHEKFFDGVIPRVEMKNDVLNYMIKEYGALGAYLKAFNEQYRHKSENFVPGAKHAKYGRKRSGGSFDEPNKKRAFKTEKK